MPTLILDLFKINLQSPGRRHLGINYLVPSSAGDRERINLASLRRQHISAMQSRLFPSAPAHMISSPSPSTSSLTRGGDHNGLGLETWEDGTVELRGFPIEDILVVRMVNKMTGETDTSYELHFEYVFDAERVADVIGLAVGPPVEKDEGPGGWRGWVVTVPKRVHHRSQMWERCMERERVGDRDLRDRDLRDRERERERELRERELRERELRERDLRERERERDRELRDKELRDRERDLKERERDLRERDRERDLRERDLRDRELRDRELRERERERERDRERERERDRERDMEMKGVRQVERRSMIPVAIQTPRDSNGGFKDVERRSMIPVAIQPPHPEPPRLKVRKSQKF
ncbi:hypothetical protein NEUTE1DRAFT_131503 [Neurospora tetrasperma FGSC 2508]|uniref:Uncharacterized protein n=1 Tax=Neurospora tetrasperma (strain FGSC 2508 / ATCC MYA-4615 / P0657) TaxID=510951 RepID=F8MS70_NEUT8|nr:uncharacterized protein NEUTE1DRAFT_131503 [Neurospora tetrasperma FGSC 2508]EGO55864.1 hypothetical protein NEUTE1DRAFT_131503 [Neurospora tetrasperma FGSC 2508]